MNCRVCFIGGARYSKPLDETQDKKFRALRELGEIYVIGFSAHGPGTCFQQQASFCLLPRFRSPVLRYAAMALVGTFLALRLILRRKVNILVAQSPYEGAVAACAKILAGWCRRRSGLVVESHGDFERALFLQRRVLLPTPYRLVMRWAAGFAFRNADALRSISRSVSRQLRRWDPAKPVVQFPAWTDIEVFKQARKGAPPRSEAILYAGVLTPLKGIHLALEAFAQMAPSHPSWRFWIVGEPIDARYSRSLMERAEKRGLSRRVRFFGHLPQRDLARRMARARLLVLPSQIEGLGRVVIEAMASGLAVVASRVGGLPEIVRHDVNGLLFDPGDLEALVGSLSRLMADPSEVSRLAQQAVRDAEGLCSPESYLAGYRRLFGLLGTEY